ncbi:MAG: hypothetical protein VX640_15335 [Pseudomonadota bacterium]|nr:hypothetical protein [Pseudomonadota bacterium]
MRLVAIMAAALFASAASAAPDASRVGTLAAEVEAKGRDPVDFVLAALESHELVVFDEGLHNAVEPWEFFSRLVADPRFPEKARYVFLEVLPYNQQRHIDAYLDAPKDDPSLLFPAFQNALATGWNYQTYYDFLSAARRANQALPAERRIRVIGVGPASYWSEIVSPEDFARYRRDGFAGYDHDMYARVLMHLSGFDGSARGVFLTNTRHAYTGLKKSDGGYFWNATTYFRQWHPGRVYSIRVNAPFLEVKKAGDEKGPTLGSMAAGVVYGWTRADGGAWDAAFAANGDRPVALSFAETSFGSAPYVGNSMLSAAPGQTMADVNDAVIHLRRLEDWRQTAKNGAMYTPAFRKELKRRLPFAHPGEELAKAMEAEGAKTVDAFIDAIAAPEPEAPLAPAQTLPPLD